MKALLIDDEPLAIASLRKIMNKHCPEVSVIGAAHGVADALPKIAQLRPEVIFLDVQMPGGSGFELLRQLPEGDRPEVIFVTSQDQYALQAIRVAALGYLIKPVIAKELVEAVALAGDRLRQKNSELRLEALLANLATKENARKRVGIPSDSGLEFVDAGEIIFCEGEDGYTRIHLEEGRHRLSSYSIGEYRKMLTPYDFFAVHRSYLVNRRHVRKHDRSGSVILSNGAAVSISRRRREAVAEWLGGKD